MKKPILLTIDELINPIDQALKRIDSIRERKAENEDSYILEGLFVLAVSTFEYSISDTLRILFNRIPEKLDIKNESIPKEIILAGNVISYSIENRILNISYKNISEIIDYFIKTSSINKTRDLLISDNRMEQLVEIKARRNLLLHNDLIVNEIYRDITKIGEASVNDRLQITQDYLYQTLVVMNNILIVFRNELRVKYDGYTKLKAQENLFNYIFPTPVMKFENEFIINKEQNCIEAYNSKESSIDLLSFSETILYRFWLSHLTIRKYEILSGSFFHLSRTNYEKLKYLIENIELLRA